MRRGSAGRANGRSRASERGSDSDAEGDEEDMIPEDVRAPEARVLDAEGGFEEGGERPQRT